MAIATASEKIAADLKESMDSLREEIVKIGRAHV